MRIRWMVIFGFICCLLMGQSNECNSEVRFKYFKYTGNDPFFEENHLSENHLYNPILPGFYPDPSICKKGGDYYMVTSTFSFFPGVPVFHSKDLVNWRQIGNILERPSQYMNKEQPISYGIFAPAISYNPHNELFYMVTTFVGGGGNFMVTAKEPKGPWSDPYWFSDVKGIDPSLFFDDDGKVYLVNNGAPEGEPEYDGHRAIWMQEIDIPNNSAIGPRKVIRDKGNNPVEKPIWIEGPHIYKINDYYYLMCAEGGTGYNHSENIYRSKNIWGPYEPNPNNPILTQRYLNADRENPVTNTGHADLIQTATGDWYSVFLGCRPYQKNDYNIGRETFLLPVSWNDGWPLILPKDKSVPMIVKCPSGMQKDDEGNFMQQGNLSYQDNFTSSTLDLSWLFIRTPDSQWYQYDSINGGLLVEPQKRNLRETKHPSFIGRRQQHHHFEVETALQFMPQDSSSFAGVTLFQNEQHHLSFGITRKNEKVILRLQKAQKSDGKVIKSVIKDFELQNNKAPTLTLKVKGEGALLSFYCKEIAGTWQLVADNIEASYLSTTEAGGFVGTVIGLYASSNE